MERIGIAASKIAKTNLLIYNLCVIVISFLCALILFLISGASIGLALIVIGYIMGGVLPSGVNEGWFLVVRMCMISLTVVVAVFNLVAIIRNVRFRKD